MRWGSQEPVDSGGAVEISGDVTGVVDSKSKVLIVGPWRQINRREGSVVVNERTIRSHVGEVSNNLAGVVDSERDRYDVATWRGRIRVLDRSEGATAVHEPAISADTGESHGANDLARVVDAESLREIRAGKIDDGKSTVTVKVPMGSCAGVEVTDNLAGGIDAVRSRGSAVRGASAGDIDRREDPAAVQESVCACAVAYVSDDLARVVDAEGLRDIRAGDIDGGERTAAKQEPMSAKVANDLAHVVDAERSGALTVYAVSGRVIDDCESVWQGSNWRAEGEGESGGDDKNFHAALLVLHATHAGTASSSKSRA